MTSQIRLCMFALALTSMLQSFCCAVRGSESTPGELIASATERKRLDRPTIPMDFSWNSGVTGPVCGPFAACAAIRRLGANVSPKSLVTAKYIGTCEGTTQGQLIAAIEDSGFEAYPGKSLSILDLTAVDLPFIALVRPSPASNRYSHWISIERREENFLVSDSGKEPYELTPAEFMGIWSGAGVFVGPKGGSSPLFDVYLVRLALLLTAICLGCLIRWAGSSLTDKCGWPARYSLLAVLTVATCFGSFLLFGDPSNTIAGINTSIAPYKRNFLEIPIRDAVVRSHEKDSLLIDARREIDFASGAIDGAINVPVYAAREDLRRFLNDTDSATKVYVYCQSAACDYDATVGRLFASLGFDNIYLCSEGIYEYQQSSLDLKNHD